MAHARATTPATPTQGTAPGAGRQRKMTSSAPVRHGPVVAPALKGQTASQASESRPRLLGGLSAPVASPIYHKIPPASRPNTPAATRITRQDDGTLPPAPERLVEEAATVAKTAKERAVMGVSTKKGAKTGAGVEKKPAKALTAKTVSKASGSSAATSSMLVSKALASEKKKKKTTATKSPVKNGAVTKTAGVVKKESTKGKSVSKG